MKNALLTTIFRVPNYGSVLQAYATQRVMEHFGYDCHVLNYDHNKGDWAKAHGVRGGSFKNKVGRLLGLKASHRKANKLDAFIRDHLHLTRQYTSIDEMRRCEGNQYDVYVAGSDQIWNTKYTNCDPAFLLEFAAEGKRRISIASSIACSHLDARYAEEFKRELCKFDGVSVREALGVKVLSDMGIGKVAQVLDPTLLLDKTQWDALRPQRGKACGRYILLYMWCYAFEPRPYIYKVLKYYQDKLNCKIIALEGFMDCDKAHVGSLDIENATDSSIADFLDYFAGASLVVTTSFHGTAFAVNYGVPLVSIVPGGGDDRQSSLLEELNLAQCRLHVDEEIGDADPFYDAHEEQGRLSTLRDASLRWIENTLE